ncbi:uncharacterized protein MONOS_2346 [Monocercomonoides exilis]|uniref:uncharacterized protein n=1 Tax=Monocercomonoides exilis TaxID=2049356 RepID=UPI003559D9ED|nr:hypothetical protein MONOS_2346 [Monocercomonoides exilis]|eukprot:MONOS_2346.1-p1 / transcript=MONOS_2346.1 / gene=MONOS_2346 / organism=Monocercomonoides_exilis_PA203 / gene_product=unspecified product / transcript_product=unspecified product / location=Mono_scaffold00048:30771-31120(-) / protein_length=98 / sequence_SO=supercontig / SO=protein_coding / is_pseudo=false
MGGRMTQDTVRAPNSDGEDRGYDLIHRLSRIENMIEEITRSQAWPSQSGATGMLPMRKVKRERLRSFLQDTQTQAGTHWPKLLSQHRGEEIHPKRAE